MCRLSKAFIVLAFFAVQIAFADGKCAEATTVKVLLETCVR